MRGCSKHNFITAVLDWMILSSLVCKIDDLLLLCNKMTLKFLFLVNKDFVYEIYTGALLYLNEIESNPCHAPIGHN